MQQSKAITLTLEDGTTFKGKSFGSQNACAGEVVFSTAMTGYPESLTDPSHSGQILVTTYPILGNYGVPPTDSNENLSNMLNSEHIHCKAIICQNYSDIYSHWQAQESLSEWLTKENVVGIYDIDTRALTKKLRDSGSMLGKITFDSSDEIDFQDPNKENLVEKISCDKVIEYGKGEKTVVLVDCGVMHSTIRYFINRNVKVIRVPYNYDFSNINYDGIFISNGPGNPECVAEAIGNIRKALSEDKPILGVGLGHQLLAIAAGAKTYKLKYGHRGHNQPVRLVGTNKCYITSQNHGYAVDDKTLPSDWDILFVNMNDNTNAGIKHKTKPFTSVQFYPEPYSGERETEFIYDKFLNEI